MKNASYYFAIGFTGLLTSFGLFSTYAQSVAAIDKPAWIVPRFSG
ncbi:hypothetical protein [Hymenobacter cellulosilyticus]|nr:hypothetical protein [Hymenobacter cellulosilyticus]